MNQNKEVVLELECPQCKGKQFVDCPTRDSQVCPTCHGEGKVERFIGKEGDVECHSQTETTKQPHCTAPKANDRVSRGDKWDALIILLTMFLFGALLCIQIVFIVWKIYHAIYRS